MKTLRSNQHRILVAELKLARLDAGLTQVELAKRMGTQQSFVAKVEGGERRLDVVEFVNWTDSLAKKDEINDLCMKLLKYFVQCAVDL